jgi:hypothetical protein
VAKTGKPSPLILNPALLAGHPERNIWGENTVLPAFLAIFNTIESNP